MLVRAWECRGLCNGWKEELWQYIKQHDNEYIISYTVELKSPEAPSAIQST